MMAGCAPGEQSPAARRTHHIAALPAKPHQGPHRRRLTGAPSSTCWPGHSPAEAPGLQPHMRDSPDHLPTSRLRSRSKGFCINKEVRHLCGLCLSLPLPCWFFSGVPTQVSGCHSGRAGPVLASQSQGSHRRTLTLWYVAADCRPPAPAAQGGRLSGAAGPPPPPWPSVSAPPCASARPALWLRFLRGGGDNRLVRGAESKGRAHKRPGSFLSRAGRWHLCSPREPGRQAGSLTSECQEGAAGAEALSEPPRRPEAWGFDFHLEMFLLHNR